MFALQRWILAVAAVAVVVAWSSPNLPAEEKEKPKGKKRQSKLVAEEGALEVVLLRHKAVQDDLKLNEAAAKKIEEFANKQWKKAKELEVAKGKKEEKWKAMEKENDEFLKDNLSEKQRQRLEQIGMQVAGLMWVTRKDVAKELKLTTDQRKKARELQKMAHKEFRDAVNAEKTEGIEDKLKELHTNNQKRLMDLLTDDQKAAWKKFAGEPFKGDLYSEK